MRTVGYKAPAIAKKASIHRTPFRKPEELEKRSSKAPAITAKPSPISARQVYQQAMWLNSEWPEASMAPWAWPEAAPDPMEEVRS
jgi:hypothetical protein